MDASLFSFARLDWSIYVSWIGVAVILLLPKGNKEFIRFTALGFAILGLVFPLVGLFTYEPTALDVPNALELSLQQFRVNVPWIPSLGISYSLGADGISLPLLILVGIVAVTGVLFSWTIETRVKEFFAFLLLLVSGAYGVFLSLDLFLLFAFYELAIIPKYFIIAIWGSTKKDYAAMKLVMFSFIGSALVFIGMLALYVAAGAHTFDLIALSKVHFDPNLQFWLSLVFTGFAILAGMWPFHTWAPTGHVAAPTAASMMLAGVVMKLGAYGCLRVAMLLMPEGMRMHGGFWQWTFAIIAVIGIVYGATVALVQKDFKFVIGYSSVSHMGFVLLGLMTLNSIGLDGAVLQMFSHGIVASLLFAVVGRMVYERAHTRELEHLSALRLVGRMPFAAGVFIVAGLASMGLPGLSGFIAELQVLVGAWKSFPWLAVVSGVGIVIAVWYTFRTVHLAFYGQGSGEPPHHEEFAPITWQEKIASAILVSLLVIVGLHPSTLLDGIHRSTQIMEQLMMRAGGG